MEEIWKDIKGYEGLYQVSNIGRVRSLKNDILKPFICKGDGHYYVGLYREGICKRYAVHRLVADTFIPNPNNLLCVNHIDEVKTNNIVSNLEWCTYRYNNRYGTKPARTSNSLKEFYKNNKSHMVGRKRTEETKQKISLSMRIYWEKKKELN